MIKISVITVCRNSAKSINRTINSVISQNYANTEYIIIDGASTDGTVDIIKSYGDMISYWVSEPDEGIYHAMNKGLKVSTGDVVCFLNSDDWFEEGVFYLVDEIYSHDTPDVVYGNVTFMAGSVIARYEDYSRIDFDELYLRMIFCHQSIFIRGDLHRNNPYDTSLKWAADYKLLLKLYTEGRSFFHMDSNTVFFTTGGLHVDHMESYYREVKDASLGMAETGNHKTDKLREDILRTYYWSIRQFHIDEMKESLYCRDWIYGRFKNYSYIIFGAAALGRECYEFFKKAGISVICFADNDSRKGEQKIDGLEILPLNRICFWDGIKVIIAASAYESEMEKEILLFKDVEYCFYRTVFQEMEADYLKDVIGV